jgi:quinol monooxygenase YgiN
VLDVRPSDGPIYTEVTYHVASEHTAEFLDAVRNLGVIRRRDGVRRWTLRRDLDAPERWIESFWVSSWGEQLVRAHRQTEESEVARARRRIRRLGRTPDPTLSGAERQRFASKLRAVGNPSKRSIACCLVGSYQLSPMPHKIGVAGICGHGCLCHTAAKAPAP